jgi:hypothetical protein
MPSFKQPIAMDPELEGLLKSYDAFMGARGGSDEQQLFALYESRIQDVATARRLKREVLDQAVKRKYLRWVQANARPSTLPPKA